MADAMKLVPVEPTEAMIDAGWNLNDVRRVVVPRVYRSMLASSPPAREEAPAEGAGERIDWTQPDAVAGALHAALPLDVDWQHIRIAGRAFVDTLTALRNRTSEPEAGESTPKYLAAFMADKGVVHLHPAPATADKLRDAVRAFMPTNIDLSNPNIRDDQVLPYDTTAGELRAIAAALNEQPQ